MLQNRGDVRKSCGPGIPSPSSQALASWASLPLPAEAHLICAHSEQARECAHWDIPVHRWVEVELVLLCAPLIDIDVVNPGPWMFMVL